MSNVGKRNHLLSLQQRENIENAYGETIPNPNWNEIVQLWGRVDPLTGNEYVIAEQHKSKANLKINTNYLDQATAALSTNMRFVDLSDQRIYNIEFTINPQQWKTEVNWFVVEDTSAS